MNLNLFKRTDMVLTKKSVQVRVCRSKRYRWSLGDVARPSGVGQRAEVLLEVLVSLPGHAG